MEKYKSLLREKNLKSTAQRALMLKALEEEGHMDIDSLKERIQKEVPTVSLNTIYLNLDQLTKEEVILKVSLNNKKSVYEIKKYPHAHLVCKICGAIEDKTLDGDIFATIKEGAKSCVFEPSFVSVNIYGVCEKCANIHTK